MATTKAETKEAEAKQSTFRDFSDYLALNKQYIKSMSFDNKPNAEKLIALNKMPQVALNVNYGANKLNEELYEIPLTIEATGTLDNEELFKVQLTYVGIFTVKNADERILPVLFMVECPHLLFPYARQIISSTIREAGYPAIFINPINFATIYRRKIEELRKQKEK